VINVHTTSTQGEARTHFEGPRQVAPWKQIAGVGNRQVAESAIPGQCHLSPVSFDRIPSSKSYARSLTSAGSPIWCSNIDYWFGRESTFDADLNVNKLPPSEYFKRNVFFTYQDDRAGVLTTPVYGTTTFFGLVIIPTG
jgi:hypothetical protein